MDDRNDLDERGREVLDPRGWLAATAVVLVLLAATGLWQSRYYRPTSTQAWDDILLLQEDPRIRPPDQAPGWVSDVHRGLAVVFVAVGAGLVLTVLRWMWREHRGDLVALAALLVGIAAGGLAFSSGHDLLWDQLALWAVTIGSDFRGVWTAAFSDQVRFVIRGPFELTQRGYASDVVGHVIAVPAVLFAALGLLALRLRRR